jgi:hypothetical protein
VKAATAAAMVGAAVAFTVAADLLAVAGMAAAVATPWAALLVAGTKPGVVAGIRPAVQGAGTQRASAIPGAVAAGTGLPPVAAGTQRRSGAPGMAVVGKEAAGTTVAPGAVAGEAIPG